MQKPAVAILHHDMFINSGSTEKLMRDIISAIATQSKVLHLEIFYNGEIDKELLEDIDWGSCTYNLVRLVGLTTNRWLYRNSERFDLGKYLVERGISLLICVVWSHDHPVLRRLPAYISLMEVSPFGHFVSNGNLAHIWVSGERHYQNLKRVFETRVTKLFNPLLVPAVDYAKLTRKGGEVLIGRSGRSDPQIFDGISLRAFSFLEKSLPGRVKFIYLNPCSEAIKLANQLGICNLEFKKWLSETELKNFYREIDVFAHARFDGETLGVAIAEAVINLNVVVSHLSHADNAHIELLRPDYSVVVEQNDVEAYFRALLNFAELRLKGSLGKLAFQGRENLVNIFDKKNVYKSIASKVNDTLSCDYFGSPISKLVIIEFYYYKITTIHIARKFIYFIIQYLRCAKF
jgi:hypothetical protein